MTEANKPRGRPFAPGNKAGARGRPPNSRNRSTLMFEKLMEADAAVILKAIITLAKNGDLMAAKWVLDKLIPAAKDRAVCIDIGPTDTLISIEAAHEAVIRAVSTGAVTPAEAASLASLIEGRRRTVEVGDMERRLAEIEAKDLKGKK